MSSPSEAVTLADDVILVPIEDGSVRLLDMGGSFFALSRSGAEILEGAMRDGLAPTTAAMAARYGVEASRIEGDAQRLIGELLIGGLLAGQRTRTPGVAGRMLGASVPALLRMPGMRASPTAVLSLARLCFVTLGWARTVELWRTVHSGAPRPITSPLDGARLDATDSAVRRAASRLPSIACKERALAAWHLLARDGIASKLVVGIQLYPLSGHVWCEAGGRVLTDHADHCAAYRQVARYDLENRRPEILAAPADARAPAAAGGSVAWSR